ncbi:hypothetical protein [Mucilaginibacter sp. NFX135]|uniref:hypothetical protein n=1 Tax=Mucilaginibacter sp. NFX135 TaxID=3402687 RepID=UPI003AFB088C
MHIDTTKVITEKKVFPILKESTDRIQFFNCSFKIAVDFYHLLEHAEIEGIERIEPAGVPEAFSTLAEPSLFISNIRFKKKIDFFNCEFAGRVSFHNVIFEKEFTFFDNHFHEDVSLSSVQFLGITQFRSIKANKAFSILNCHIDMPAIGFRTGHFDEGLMLYNTKIKGELDLGNTVCIGTLLIRECDIPGKLNLSSCELENLQLIGNDRTQELMQVKELLLNDTTITGQLQIERVKIDLTFGAHFTKFKGAVFVNRSHFCGKNYWISCVFEKTLSINRTIFVQHLSLSDSKFEQAVRLNRSDYRKAEVYFNESIFNSDLSIGGNLSGHKIDHFQGLLCFQGALFSINSIVRIFRLNTKETPLGEIQFTNALVKGLIDIEEVYLNKVSFERTIVSGNIQVNTSLLPAIKDSNSARLLKHEARKINNHVAAQHYYRMEMAIYSRSLKWYSGDRFLLFLNQASNNYGLSWTRGVGFTMISGFVFYAFFSLAKTNYSLNFLISEKFAAGFINFFWLPTGFGELVTILNPSHITGGACGALSFILGKIAIAYGIYQTIAAFRKHLQ